MTIFNSKLLVYQRLSAIFEVHVPNIPRYPKWGLHFMGSQPTLDSWVTT